MARASPSSIRARRVPLYGLFAAMTIGLAGCGGSLPSLGSLFGGESEPPIETRPAEDIFAEARAQLEDDEARNAARLFDEVERLYPYSDLAKKAMLMSAYSSYEAADYDDAITAAQRSAESSGWRDLVAASARRRARSGGNITPAFGGCTGRPGR